MNLIQRPCDRRLWRRRIARRWCRLSWRLAFAALRRSLRHCHLLCRCRCRSCRSWFIIIISIHCDIFSQCFRVRFCHSLAVFFRRFCLLRRCPLALRHRHRRRCRACGIIRCQNLRHSQARSLRNRRCLDTSCHSSERRCKME